MSPSRLPLASFPARTIKPREVGRSGRTTNSFITTGSTKAGTMRPGNSRNSFQKRFARASDRCDHRRRNWQPDLCSPEVRARLAVKLGVVQHIPGLEREHQVELFTEPPRPRAD